MVQIAIIRSTKYRSSKFNIIKNHFIFSLGYLIFGHHCFQCIRKWVKTIYRFLLCLQMGKHAMSLGWSFCWREFSCCVREMTSNAGLFVQCFVIVDALQYIVIIMMIIIVSIKVIKTFLFLLQNPFVLKIISHVIQTRKWDFYEQD